MRKLKIFISICLLSSTLPTSALASYTLDQDNNGVDIQDVLNTIQNEQAMRTITGKNIFEQADIRNLLRQIQPSNHQAILGTVAGFVTDETGAAFSGAEITLVGTGLVIETNTSGQFQFNDVPITYQTKVQVNKEGYDLIASEVFNIQTGDIRNLPNMVLRKTPAYGSVSGYVYGPDNVALASAFVTIDNPTTHLTGYTSSTGFFIFSQVPTGDHSLTVTKDTYTPYTTVSFNVTKDNPTTIPTIHLAKAGTPQLTGSIQGIVTSDNNQPLGDALVSVTGTTYSNTTDNNGSFTLSNVPAGIVQLQIVKEGYQPRTISGINVSEHVYDAGTIKLSPVKGIVKGMVIDEDGHSISGALASLDGVSATTNESGEFTFSDVTPRSGATLIVTRDTYETATVPTFDLTPGQTKELGNVVLKKVKVSISGNITSTTGSSLASAQIHVKGTETTVYTDTSGNFTIHNLPVGNHTLQISAENYVGQVISVNVLQTGNPPVSVGLARQTANVQGYARSTTGEFITYTQATIPGTSYTAYVNENGQFTFYNLPVGYTIQEIAIADYQPKLPLTAITVTPNLNSIGTLEFQPMGTITGVVRASDAANNNPVLSNVTVTLQEIGGSFVQTVQSDAEGAFSFTNIPVNANYTLTIEKAGYILYPLEPFALNKGLNYKYLYLQQGVAVTNETQLLAAYADPSVPYILLLNDIQLTEPFNFNRAISLRGATLSNSNIKLSSPKFSISSAGVGWSGIDMYCEVGNDETKLQGALYSFVGAIKLNGLGNYDGFIRIVSQKNYYITDGTSNLTAFVNNAEGLVNALANPDVSTIYVAENINSYGNLDFPNRPIHFISQSEKTIQKDSYSNTSQVQLTNVRLLPEHDTVPPILTAVSTGVVELDLHDVTATLNESATLYLVPEGTTRVLGEITLNAVSSVFASTSGQASVKLTSVPPGDYILYAVDSAGNISTASATINVHKSLSKVLSDIRNALTLANMAWITKYDFIRAGIQNIDGAQLEMYQIALSMDKDELLSAPSDQDFVASIQSWVDTANAAPIIHRALMLGINNSSYDWSVLNSNAEAILSAYQLTGISSSSQLAVAEHVMELAFQRGNYKLLTKTEIQEAIYDTLPSTELSNWVGTPVQQGLGTRRVALSFSMKNAKGVPLQGYTADDLTIKINDEEINLSDTEAFPSFAYDTDSSSYQIVFEGSESSTTYTLSDLSLRGTVIQGEALSVTTPSPGVPVTSISMSIYTNSTRIPTRSSSTVTLIIAPFTATNKDIVWHIEPSEIATISQQGNLNVTGIGHFTLTATNPLSGISQTLELEAVDTDSALSAVQAYAASGGTSSLSLEVFKNTCVGNIVDSAFENYKRAILAKRGQFVGLQNYQISNLLQDIISEYTSTAALNQALYAYIDDNPTVWDALDKDALSTMGVYQADTTNFQYVKQVILDTFIEDGGPFGRTDLNILVTKVPSFSIRSYNPTVYATQLISQHLNSAGSNVVVTFKVANLYNVGNTGLTSQDLKAIVGGESRGLYDSSLFSNFLNLGGGVYSVEVLESALTSPLLIEALTVRVSYTDIPIATDISVNRQAALIEQSVANHTLSIVDELLFTVGNLPSLLGLSFTTLASKLESAYVAHGNVLTEGSIRRIINGMHVVRSYHQTQSATTDTYSLEFQQNITGSLMYSIFARNQSGYLATNGTGYSTNVYDFTFGHTSSFPVIFSYIATPTEKLRYSSDNSVVPDFEIIFTNPS